MNVIEPIPHSKVGPSSFKRTLNCYGWLALKKFAPEPPQNEAGFIGTVAHEVAEKCLKEDLDPSEFIGQSFKSDDGRFEYFFDEIDAQHVETYLNVLDPYIAAYQKTTAEGRLRIPSISEHCFGTSDFLAWDPRPGAIIAGFRDHDYPAEIVDLKYGVVPVTDTVQLAAYGIGLIDELTAKGERVPSHVRVTIVQPRIPNGIWSKTFTREELAELAQVYADAAETALLFEASVGSVEAVTRKDVNPGDHCRYCPAEGVCVAKYEEATALLGPIGDIAGDTLTDALDVSNLTLEQLELVKFNAPALRKFIDAAEKAVREHALRGVPMVYHKVVKRKDNRVFDPSRQDYEQIAEEFDIDPALLFKPVGKTELSALLPRGQKTKVPDRFMRGGDTHSLTVIAFDASPRKTDEVIQPQDVSKVLETLNEPEQKLESVEA